MTNEGMTNKQIIAVVKAAEDGKDIQFKIGQICSEWQETDRPGWDFHRCVFRVKPEPLHGWILINNDDSLSSNLFYPDQASARKAQEEIDPTHSTIVKMVEAPDEEQPF